MITSDPDFVPAMATETVACPVCGSDTFRNVYDSGDYEYRLPGIFHIACCSSCSLIYQNPRPPFSEILRYYTENYEPFHNVGSPLMRMLRKRFLEEPRVRRYHKLVKGKPHPVRILDVGCGQGDLLRQLVKEPAFLCEGVEPVERAAAIAQSHGVMVSRSTLEEAHYPSGRFDLVIMNHVLEHLPNPENVMDEVVRILNDRGVVCGETPCSKALERYMFGPYWSMYHLPRHLTFFSPHLLERFLIERGFTHVTISLQPQPSSWQASVRNYLNARNTPLKWSGLFNGHASLMNMATLPFSWVAAKMGYAPIVHFVAKK